MSSQTLNRVLAKVVRTFNRPNPVNIAQRTMSSYQLPSTMMGDAVSVLVAPGLCQFNAEFTLVPLIERTQVSPTSSVLRFGLPHSNTPLNLSTCACILAGAEINGENVVRPYTPISTNAQVGSFDLLVKDYGENAKMSHHLCREMKIGDQVKFKHIEFNVKTQAPFPDDEILMLVGGTGVTPMIQALHAILGSAADKPKVTMMYGSRESNDILGKELLEKWAKDHPKQFQLIHVLSHELKDSAWDGKRGYIDKELIASHFPGPETKNTRVFVCGPPPMYDAFCGPRDKPDEVTGILGEMGYGPDQVYKF